MGRHECARMFTNGHEGFGIEWRELWGHEGARMGRHECARMFTNGHEGFGIEWRELRGTRRSTNVYEWARRVWHRMARIVGDTKEREWGDANAHECLRMGAKVWHRMARIVGARMRTNVLASNGANCGGHEGARMGRHECARMFTNGHEGFGIEWRELRGTRRSTNGETRMGANVHEGVRMGANGGERLQMLWHRMGAKEACLFLVIRFHS
jgi:hypothetical protein